MRLGFWEGSSRFSVVMYGTLQGVVTIIAVVSEHRVWSGL